LILLDWEGAPSIAPGAVLLFGSGLIGGAVADAFRRAVPSIRIRRLAWTWPKPDHIEVATVEKAARQVLAVRKGARLSVVWAAGRSGFGTSVDGMADEFGAFEQVCTTARRLGANLPRGHLTFVHVSSAGGLFEGQVACGRDAVPAPLRPYGDGKLAQECAVLRDDALGSRLILRPSSVYGYGRSGRRGLISTLVAAGIQRRRASIVAALPTLRDYLFAPDIGQFIAAELLKPFSRSKDEAITKTVLLASGRPASVFEILRLVEAQVGTSLYLNVDPRPENARYNTFLSSALPEGFRPTSLEEGVARTAAAMSHERHAGAAL
jgi:UDP-glucose 4-epimerase